MTRWTTIKAMFDSYRRRRRDRGMARTLARMPSPPVDDPGGLALVLVLGVGAYLLAIYLLVAALARAVR